MYSRYSLLRSWHGTGREKKNGMYENETESFLIKKLIYTGFKSYFAEFTLYMFNHIHLLHLRGEFFQ